jgi:hypothetical protein
MRQKQVRYVLTSHTFERTCWPTNSSSVARIPGSDKSDDGDPVSNPPQLGCAPSERAMTPSSFLCPLVASPANRAVSSQRLIVGRFHGEAGSEPPAAVPEKPGLIRPPGACRLARITARVQCCGGVWDLDAVIGTHRRETF